MGQGPGYQGSGANGPGGQRARGPTGQGSNGPRGQRTKGQGPDQEAKGQGPGDHDGPRGLLELRARQAGVKAQMSYGEWLNELGPGGCRIYN